MTTNQTIDGVSVSLTDEQVKDLLRFHETTEDGQDYDVSKDGMKALARIGAVRWCGGSRYDFTDVGIKLRALLDAPAVNTDVRTILLDVTPGFDGMGHEVYARSVEDVEDALSKQGERIEELEMELHRIKAAQPQGEPVAWEYRMVNKGAILFDDLVPSGWLRCSRKQAENMVKHPCTGSFLCVVRPLYAEQPAPVAVVMPERKTVSVGVLSESNTHNQGWNACLDELKRLNTK